MSVLAWWLFLAGMWPLADPGHDQWTTLVIADLLLHGIGAGWLIISFLTKRGGWQQIQRSTIGCVFGGHRSCDGWADAPRTHGLGYQHPCGCRCHQGATR